MFTRQLPLWPIHYKPLPDELLSSWLIRLSQGHGLKVQTFCNLIFGNRLQVWNRDVDRLGPDWLVRELAARTATPLHVASATSLRTYEGVVFPEFKVAGMLPWVLTMQMYHRKREGFGLQYCPLCLRRDKRPYFRRAWRLAFNTACDVHNCMLHDRCSHCGDSLAPHRGDVGREVGHVLMLGHCATCGGRLSDARPKRVQAYHEGAWAWLKSMRSLVKTSGEEEAPGTLRVMRHLTALLTSRYASIRLHEHVCDHVGVDPILIGQDRTSFESRPIEERHHLIQLAGWLMQDTGPRLAQAWRAKAVRFNHLLKDFADAPSWYVNAVHRLPARGVRG